MQKSNLFFTYLGKLNLEEKLSKNENKKDDVIVEFDETTMKDNEWKFEYELIYKSYSLEY